MTIRDINLVPGDLSFRRQLRRHLGLWSAGLGLTLLAVIGAYGYQTRVIWMPRHPLTTLTQMQVQMGATIEEIAGIQKEIERLSQQEAFLDRLTQFRPLSTMLADIADLMNPGTWLTQLIVETPMQSDQAARLTLSGYALSNEYLGDFLDRLAKAPFCDGVVLKFANEADWKSPREPTQAVVKVIQFQIDCTAGKA